MLAMAECGFTESAFQSVDGTPGGTGLQLASPLGSLPRTATVQVALTGSTLRFSDRFSIQHVSWHLVEFRWNVAVIGTEAKPPSAIFHSNVFQQFRATRCGEDCGALKYDFNRFSFKSEVSQPTPAQNHLVVATQPVARPFPHLLL